MNKRYNILIFGPQGSGKGTQAEMLSQLLGVPHISPGVIYRHIQGESHKFAEVITSYLDKGQLVPDNYTNQIISERVKEPGCQRGFILDGYPRNKVQADYLVKIIPIDYVIVITLPDEEGVRRIAKRWQCHQGHTYHEEYAPPKIKGVCDVDDERLFQRSDEAEEAVKQRLAIYHQETEPLLVGFRQRGIRVIEIDGRPPIAEVSEEMKKKLRIK